MSSYKERLAELQQAIDASPDPDWELVTGTGTGIAVATRPVGDGRLVQVNGSPSGEWEFGIVGRPGGVRDDVRFASAQEAVEHADRV